MSVTQTATRPTQPLGDELPLFCEKCGYSLNALPVCKCAECQLLHFACPECGHHQPINTVRPAMHRALGRLRAVSLIGIVLFKLGMIGGALLGWLVMGGEWYFAIRTLFGDKFQQHYYYETSLRELFFAFGIFGFLYGGIGRMLLLRWRSGIAAGLGLGLLACLAIFAGWNLRQMGRQGPLPYAAVHMGQLYVMFVTIVTTLIGAVSAWPMWWAVVKLLLPTRAGETLLAWQRGLSDRPVTALGRE